MVSGEISFVGETDQYTFSANAGETIFLSVADTQITGGDSGFTPRIELFDPSGREIETGQGSLVASLDISLTETGVYTARVFNNSNASQMTGSYDLYFARTPGANDDGPLSNGQRHEGFIDLGDIDSYTFAANAGETVFLRVADTQPPEIADSGFTPRVVLFDPSGREIETGLGTLVGSLDTSLTDSGLYTVLVFHNGNGNASQRTGSYDLYFARAPGANDDGPLSNGQRHEGFIDLGDIDSYTFTANAGETVFLRVADTQTTEFIDSGFTPRIVLFDPSGREIESGLGSLVGSLDITLTDSGIYTVLVFNNSNASEMTGSYDLYFALAPGASADGCVADGQSTTGFIDLGDIDSYSFMASAGTQLDVIVTDLDDGPLRPFVRLVGPTGSVLASRLGDVTARIDEQLPVSGTYTLIIVDQSQGFSGTGNYRIEIFGTSITCPVVSVCNGLNVTVDIGAGDVPTSGDDVILGTSGADFIDAGAGDDTICAMGGADTILAGGGADYVDGGNGADHIFGEGGNDIIFGGSGADEIDGGGGDDEIFGEAGGDVLVGRTGEDILDGGAGVDSISGGPQADTIFTGSGATVGTGLFVTGGGAADTIFGGPDADDLRGAAGADTIRGEGGDDVITGGIGQDELFGGNGDDTIRGQGNRDDLFGEAGDDDLTGGAGDDDLDGGSGIDSCAGQAGTGDTAVNCESESTIP